MYTKRVTSFKTEINPKDQTRHKPIVFLFFFREHDTLILGNCHVLSALRAIVLPGSPALFHGNGSLDSGLNINDGEFVGKVG